MRKSKINGFRPRFGGLDALARRRRKIWVFLNLEITFSFEMLIKISQKVYPGRKSQGKILPWQASQGKKKWVKKPLPDDPNTYSSRVNDEQSLTLDARPGQKMTENVYNYRNVVR